VSAEKTGRAYVEEARQELTHYAQGLLHENEKLRAAVATLESDNRRLESELTETHGVRQQKETLRRRQDVLEHETAEAMREAGMARHERDQAVAELTLLRARLEEIEQENDRHLQEYQQVEQQTANLSNLYVASYQLHSSVDRDVVLKTIEEIVINLIGSEEMAIFEADERGRFRVAASVGIDASRFGPFRLGEGPIGRRLAAGEVFVNESPAESHDGLTACVPLKIGESTIGALAVFRLLAHKPALERLDRELFELLAVHASTALHCATLHARALLEGVPQ